MRRFIGLAPALLLATSAAPVAAQVVLEPNQIKGTLRFTNTEPAVLSLLDQIGFRGVNVDAYSTSTGNYRSSSGWIATPSSPREAHFELSAEAGAGGTTGVT